jgi:hypothetical protein
VIIFPFPEPCETCGFVGCPGHQYIEICVFCGKPAFEGGLQLISTVHGRVHEILCEFVVNLPDFVPPKTEGK